MTILSDIVVAVGELRDKVKKVSAAGGSALDPKGDFGSGEQRFFERPTDSIARKAKKSVLFYPLVASESLSPETVSMLAKLVQVRAAEYLRLYVSNLDVLDAEQIGKGAVISTLRGHSLKDAAYHTEANELFSYVVKNAIHLSEQNYFPDESIHAPMEKFLFEGKTNKFDSQDDNDDEDSAAYDAIALKAAEEIQKKQDIQDGLDAAQRKKDYTEWVDSVTKKPATQKVKQVSSDTILNALERREARRDAKATSKATASVAAKAETERNQRIDDAINAANGKDTKRATNIVAELMFTNNGEGLDKLMKNKSTADIVEMIRKLGDASPEVVEQFSNSASWKAADFDKVNRIVPLVLELTLQYKVDGTPYQTKVALGVKSVGHIVPSLDLVTGLGTALQRDSLVLQTLRLTSGETSFMKDFVLNLDVAKARSSGSTSGGRKTLETLRRQAEWNRRRGNAFIAMASKRGFVPPTATMVVTADEVSQIRSTFGVDFSKPSVARELMNSHNLMGFMIVDEAIGLVRVFEDGDDDFDRVPFSEVKEKGKETSMKDILTLMGRT